MEIKTKYKLGDEFWVVEDEKVVPHTVDNIIINVSKSFGDFYAVNDRVDIYYESNSGKRRRVKEEEFFPSKQKLLHYL